jgi:DNA-binding SARP family transcriptional activator
VFEDQPKRRAYEPPFERPPEIRQIDAVKASRPSICVLGGLKVLFNRRALALPASKKTRALLAYLIVTGREHSRERLVELFWDVPDDPRGALRWSVWKLRQLFAATGVIPLVATRDQVRFDCDLVEVDIAAARAALSAGVTQAPTALLEDAHARFGGELAEGLDLPDCYRYQEWLVGEREAMRALHTSVLSTLVERHASRPDRALELARAWLSMDPLREDGHIAVVQLLGRLGRPREAIAQYEACRRILETELGVAPSAALERARLSASKSAGAPAPFARAEPAAATAKSMPPLAGRDAECAAIDTLVTSMIEGRCRQALVFLGDPGIGKTRLLEELERRVELAGGVVLSGRAFEAERVRPYGAWVDALHSIRNSGTPIDSADSGSREQLFEAIVQLLAEESQGRTVAVVLDDIQWFDEASAALLHYAVRSGLGGHLLIACAARAGELADNSAVLRTMRALARDGRLLEVSVPPLSREATLEIARAVSRDPDPERVWRESEGNPLFAIEIARALGRDGSSRSETLEQLIGDRLLRPDDTTRGLLAWLAVFGRDIAPALLVRLTRLPETEVFTALDMLERLAIVRQSGEDAYSFVHDVVRITAYAQIPSPRRKLLHLRIAEGLSALPDPNGTLAGDVARHAAEGGDYELCVRSSVRGGEHCLSVFAFTEAEALAYLGLRQSERLPSETRIPLQLALYKILVHPGVRLRRPGGIAGDVIKLCAEAQSAGFIREMAEGLHLIGWILHRTWGDVPRARALAAQVMEMVKKLPVPQNLDALLSSARCMAVLEVHMPKAVGLFEELGAFGTAAVTNVHFQWGLGLVLKWQGDISGARAALQKGVALARERRDSWAEFECAHGLAALELEAGPPETAAALCRELEALAARFGEGGSEGLAARALAALAAIRLGDSIGRAALTDTIARLQSIDAKFVLAYVLNSAAELDLGARRWQEAREHAKDGLAAARVSDRAPEIVRARVLLAQASFGAADVKAAERELAEIDAADVAQLSARMRAILDRLSGEVAGTGGAVIPARHANPRSRRKV